MLRNPKTTPRRGATLVESALVLPLTFLLILGLLIGGMGIFRYQEAAHLARLAARFASTHAAQYERDNALAIQAGTLPYVDKNYLITNVVNANAAALDTTQLSVAVTITMTTGPSATQTYDWDDTTHNSNRAVYSAYTDLSTQKLVDVTNTVNVTVTYPWIPELFLVGPINLTSTAVMPLSY